MRNYPKDLARALAHRAVAGPMEKHLGAIRGRLNNLDQRIRRHDRRLRPLEQAHSKANLAELQEELRSITARVRVLEDEIQESRQLNRRIAELADVLSEVLLPAVDRDESRLRERLSGYGESMKS